MLLSGDNVHTIITELNNILIEVDAYFKANRLTVNTDKTKYMIFNTPYNKRKDNDTYFNNDVKTNVHKKKQRQNKYPCGQCSKGGRTDAIVCDICCKWYHRQCLPNLTKADLNKLSKTFPNMWTCPNCINEIFPLGLINSNILEHPISDIKNNKGACERCLPQLN